MNSSVSSSRNPVPLKTRKLISARLTFGVVLSFSTSCCLIRSNTNAVRLVLLFSLLSDRFITLLFPVKFRMCMLSTLMLNVMDMVSLSPTLLVSVALNLNSHGFARMSSCVKLYSVVNTKLSHMVQSVWLMLKKASVLYVEEGVGVVG